MLLRGEEREQVLEEWNGTEEEYRRASACMSCLRSRRGGEPEAVAVEYEGERGELWGVEPAGEPVGDII